MADSNNYTKLLTALVGPMQNVEDAFVALLTERRLDVAVGAQLDLIGKLVGQARGGLLDDDYRVRIRARIATNRSNGTIPDLIKIARLVLGSAHGGVVRVSNEGVAALTVRVESDVVDQDLAEVLSAYLNDGASAGVRVVTETWPSAESSMFSLAPFSGSGTGLGLGSTLDASVGGVLASGQD